MLFSENFLKTSSIVILEFNILKISWSANSALTKSSIKEGIEENKKESWQREEESRTVGEKRKDNAEYKRPNV